MKGLGSFLTFLALAAMVVAPPAHAGTVVNMTIPPTPASLTHPCTGEAVTLTGNGHLVIGVTSNSNGFHMRLHVNFQDVKGTGQTTGTKFEVPSTLNNTITVGSAQTVTFTFNGRFVAQGAVPNFNAHENFHVTVDANGNVTAFQDNLVVHNCGT